MRYPDAVAYLDRHVNFEASPAVAGRIEGLSLDRIERLLATLGDPHRSYPVIHITGTNGKGSVARLVTQLLVESGLSVGTYTSPHLERVNERLAWNGEPIADDELARVLGDLEAIEALSGVDPSYFELLTTAAFAWFSELAVDVAVIEVGLLGRWDATNVVDGDVAVITNIGGDHTDFALGWRESVAREKAGIIKPGSAVVVGECDPTLLEIFEDTAALAGGTLWTAGRELALVADEVAVGGRVIGIRTPNGRLDDVFVSLHGEHQAANALLAVAAVEAFFGRALDPAVVTRALGSVTVPGRLEVLRRHPLVVVDGAHNAEGAAALRIALSDFGAGGRGTLVLGVLRGRDPARLLDALDVASWQRVIATTAPSPRGLPAIDLASIAAAAGSTVVEVEPDPIAAVRRGVSKAGEDDLVLVTGSLYLVGAARAAAGLVGDAPST